MGTTRRIIPRWEINVMNSLSVISWPSYTLTRMRIRPNMDKFWPGLILSQQSLINDQYPKTVSPAKSNNVLSNHRFDITNKAGSCKNPGNHNKDKDQKNAEKEDKDMMNFSVAQLARRKMILNTVYFHLDIPQTTLSCQTQVDTNSLIATFWLVPVPGNPKYAFPNTL